MSFSPCIIIEGSYLQTFFHSLLKNQEKIMNEHNETLTSIQACQDIIADIQKQIATSTVESTEQ